MNRLKQYYMNLGEIGQLKIVQNVNELYDIWKGLKEDEVLREGTQNSQHEKENPTK